MRGLGSFFAVLFLSFGLILAQVKELQCDDGIDNDGDGKVDCADPNCRRDPICLDGGGEAAYPTLVMVDSLDQEIGLVVNRLESFKTSYYVFHGATVAAEVIGASGQSLTALFNVSSSYIRGNIQSLDPDMRSSGAVLFTDPGCTDAAYIRAAQSPSAALLTAVSPSPGGECCDLKPGTILYVAEPGTPVQIGSYYSIDEWGGCFFHEVPVDPVLPVAATVDLTVFVPPFAMVLR